MNHHRKQADLAVVGGGILGLAHAWLAAKSGRSVVLFERASQATGASIRNFGLIWPVGQPPGPMHEMALRSRELWLEILDCSGLPFFPTGSLHAAYHADEEAVAREFVELAPGHGCEWMEPDHVSAHCPAVRREGLRGALWSPHEITVDPRLVVGCLPRFLEERYGVVLRYGCSVHSVSPPKLETGDGVWEAAEVVICAGDDFAGLYPEVLAPSGITRCKLQMMRTLPQPAGWTLGPALAGGLTMRFYPSFKICRSLEALTQRVATEMPAYDRWGIHVMLSQTPAGELTIGDSHEYGLAVDIFDKPEIDELILRYLLSFTCLPEPRIAQRWHGVYAKHPDRPYYVASPAPGVRIVTATGGAGMTLSFGLAEKVLEGGA